MTEISTLSAIFPINHFLETLAEHIANPYPIFAIQTAQLTKKTYISPRILLHPPPLENQQSHTPNLHTLQYLNFSPLKLPYRRRLHWYASLKLVRVCYVQSLFVIVIFLELVRDLRQHHLRSSNNIRFAESDLRTDTYEDIEIREGIEADIGEHFSSMHIAEEEDFPMIYYISQKLVSVVLQLTSKR
ncbi:hypothetical protein HKD37_10G028947 [Glycine soja]